MRRAFKKRCGLKVLRFIACRGLVQRAVRCKRSFHVVSVGFETLYVQKCDSTLAFTFQKQQIYTSSKRVASRRVSNL